MSDQLEKFSLYILRCADGTYYTGIARDVANRMADHQGSIRGAKYLRGRTPFELVFEKSVGDRSAAQKIEYQVKKLSRTGKQDLISGRMELPGLR